MHKKIFNAQNSNSTKEKIANNIVYQLLLAVNYMHTKGTIHRDIKLENLMVEITEENGKERVQIKLTDFGFATVI